MGRTQRQTYTLDDARVKQLLAPPKGSKVYYDDEETGFGCRVTAAGFRAFVLNYYTAGRERRYTIGACSTWKTAAARKEAKRLKLQLEANGIDPLAKIQAERGEPTVRDLCERYIEDHLPTKRERSALDDRGMIAKRVLPALGPIKVRDVTFSNIDALHRSITKSGLTTRANRVATLLSTMFEQAIRWGWRTDNPCRGIKHNGENKRERYLSGTELAALTEALDDHPDQQAANIIRLLLLTGARRGEVFAATWDQFDLEAGVWVKPASVTKTKKLHRVPLSAPARLLLADLPQEGAYVFPGRYGGHRQSVKRAWAELCESAGIRGARVHDLRHTFASLLASSGQSLPIIGALLGHSNPATTARYAHLLDDPLRQATETAGALITGKPSAEVISIKYH